MTKDLKDKRALAPENAPSDDLQHIFDQAFQKHGDPGRAFVAVLKALQTYITQTKNEIDTDKQVFWALKDAIGSFETSLNGVPGKTEQSIQKSLEDGLQGFAEPLRRSVAHEIERSNQDLRNAVFALNRAQESFELENYSRNSRARWASIGLPIAFATAIVLGSLVGSTVIPVLPSSWQWPCGVVGAEFYEDPSTGKNYCLIQR